MKFANFEDFEANGVNSTIENQMTDDESRMMRDQDIEVLFTGDNSFLFNLNSIFV